jgi:histo-blood group ABO system transferase
MKVCVLTIATNKYIQFVEKLYNHIEENFLNGHDVNCVLFTEHEVETSDNVKVCSIEHEEWPMPTLKRYNYFTQYKDLILSYDYCYYMDVDMEIPGKVGEEIFSDLVATKHFSQSFYDINTISYDRNSKSLAYVPYGEGRTYYAGGFNGGKTERFIEMSEVIASRVNQDLENGIIALWHDESHMNRYLIDNPPTLELNPNYCYPQAALWNPNGWIISRYYNEPKILALEKNHNEVRY